MSWEQTKYLEERMNKLEEKIQNVNNSTERVISLSGFGHFIRVYSTKSYLEGFKVLITDGVVAKSSFIFYDSDSKIYAAELIAPYEKAITIQIYYKEQLEAEFTPITINYFSVNYSTFNLDALIKEQHDNLFSVQGEMFERMARDPLLVNDTELFSNIVTNVVNGEKPLDETINQISDLKRSIGSKTLDELLHCREDLLSISETSFGPTFFNTKAVYDKIRNEDAIIYGCVLTPGETVAIEKDLLLIEYTQPYKDGELAGNDTKYSSYPEYVRTYYAGASCKITFRLDSEVIKEVPATYREQAYCYKGTGDYNMNGFNNLPTGDVDCSLHVNLITVEAAPTHHTWRCGYDYFSNPNVELSSYKNGQIFGIDLSKI